MRLLAAEPRSIAVLLFPYQYLYGMILVTPYSMEWYWRLSREGPMPFLGQVSRSFFVSYCFAFLVFHSIGWYCGVGVFGRIGCYSLSPSLTLPTFFNNNKNNNKNYKKQNFSTKRLKIIIIVKITVND